MKVSKEELKIVTVQYLEEEDDSIGKIIVFPCRNQEAANEFEDFYRKKIPQNKLLNISIVDSPIYG